MRTPSSHSRSNSPYSSSFEGSEIDSVVSSKSSITENTFYSGSVNKHKKNLNTLRHDHVTDISSMFVDGVTQEDLAARLQANKRQSNWPGAAGMSQEEFIARAKELNLTPEEAKKLTQDVEAFVKSLLEPDEGRYEHANQTLRHAEMLPPSPSWGKIIRTNSAAGMAAFSTSFFLGKLATSLTVHYGGPQYAWIFPVVAGVLNVMLSEPVAGAIRTQGAFCPSLDGTAYADYNTASARLYKAKTLNDTAAIARWSKEITKIVNALIDREQAHPSIWFRSGVNKPALNADDISAVINAARKRAFVSDEMPFLWFTLLYTITGAAAPYFKEYDAALIAMGKDIACSFSAGIVSGALTSVTQVALRRVVQQAPYKDFSMLIKHAKKGVPAAKEAECLERLIKITACERTLEERINKIKKAEKDKLIDHSALIEKIEGDYLLVKNARKEISDQLQEAKKEHILHTAQRKRCGASVLSAMNAYIGEKSDPPKPFEGRRAINRLISKVLATPLSLTLTPLYNLYMVPIIVNAFYPEHGLPDPASNFTTYNDTFSPAPQPMFNQNSHSDKLGATMFASALYGIPMILGYAARNQLVASGIEKAGVYFEALYGNKDAPESVEKAEDKDTSGDGKKITDTDETQLRRIKISSGGSDSSNASDDGSKNRPSGASDASDKSYNSDSTDVSNLTSVLVSENKSEQN